MIFQIVSLVCIVFFVSVLFYKQRRDTVEILQSEYTSHDSLKELVSERQPIIIRNTPTPQSLTMEQISKMQRLHDILLREGLTLRQYFMEPGVVEDNGNPLISSATAALLSRELALSLWVSHTIQESIQDMDSFFGMFYTRSVQCSFGGIGMRRSTAVMTFFLPVEGTYMISLVNPKSESFLPRVWKNRYPRTLTINDSPLVGELKYIDIILRPGTMICLPTHTIFSIEPDSKTYHSGLFMEFNSPVSSLAKILDGDLD